MATLPSIPQWVPAWQIGVLLAVVLSGGVVWWLDRDRGWGRRRRSRLLLGVPWGTVTSVVGVLCVYLFVQGGWEHWHNPVTIPFRSWSYRYPLGVLVAPFGHNGVGHITGNLLSTVVFGTLAEYAWGHFPEERGESAFDSARTNPYVRAFVLFPAGVVAVGLATSLFSWGPVIGFSGVVFAFVGFALVRYPIGTVVAIGASDVVTAVYRALQNPVFLSKAEPRFVEPWWAGIAVQGHLLGLFLGLLVGALVLRRRETDLGRLWVGGVIVATSYTIWALWWYRGNNQYVLYRGLGVMLVFVLAALVALSLRTYATDGSLWAGPTGDVSPRLVALLVLLVPILVVAAVAVPLNLAAVTDDGVPGDGPEIEARDYTIAYAENVTSGMTDVVDVSFLGETTQVRTSGVIVVSEDRHIWTTAKSTSRLAFAGRVRVHVGGLGWRETVIADRDGWSAAGGGTAYRVAIKRAGGPWQLAHLSEPAVADPTLSGMKVAVIPAPDAFSLELRRNGSAIARTALPVENQSVRGAGITFVRDGKAVYATYNDTRIRIASRETYRGE